MSFLYVSLFRCNLQVESRISARCKNARANLDESGHELHHASRIWLFWVNFHFEKLYYFVSWKGNSLRARQIDNECGLATESSIGNYEFHLCWVCKLLKYLFSIVLLGSNDISWKFLSETMELNAFFCFYLFYVVSMAARTSRVTIILILML